MTIETDFYTDPMCIWALVAEPKLDAMQAEFGARLRVSHQVVPVFGSIDERFATGGWSKGGIERRVEATARVARLGGFETVTGACWHKAPASSWGPSADDADITRRAEQKRVLEAVDLPVGHVFARVDDGPGFARLSEAVARREALRIEGSPTWIFDGGRARLFGNVDERVLRATIQALLDGEEAGSSSC